MPFLGISSKYVNLSSPTVDTTRPLAAIALFLIAIPATFAVEDDTHDDLTLRFML